MSKRKKTPDVPVSFKLDDRLRSAIRRAAEERGVSASDVIRDAVSAFVGVCPTCGHDHGRRRREVAA